MPREPSAVWPAGRAVAEMGAPLARSGLAGSFASSAITEVANRAARATTHKDFIDEPFSRGFLEGANPSILQCTMTHPRPPRKPSSPRTAAAPVHQKPVVVSDEAKEGLGWLHTARVPHFAGEIPP